MKFFGDIDLQQNKLKNALVSVDSAFPLDAQVGQFSFKDRILYLCTEIVDNAPIWVQLTNEVTAHTYVQTTASTQWLMGHPLNTRHVTVTVYSDAGQQIIPSSVNIIETNQVNLVFPTDQSGWAVISTGTLEGQSKPIYGFDFEQTVPSTTWQIVHALGRYPTIRVFVDNTEVEPESIVFNSYNTITVTFASATVGIVKLI